ESIEIQLSDRIINIENENYEPLGIEFLTMLIDEPKACHNKCVFCFIDQLPKGMRSSCYFKDDDYRLSFLQGNYVTLTNMTPDDIDRLIEYNIPRINISIHTTNPELRVKMLHNKNAGNIMEYLKRFSDGGLNMNGQIVLCPGYNDGEELNRTINDISNFSDNIESVSIVPVGISAHREGLTDLKKFDVDSARLTIQHIEMWQEKFRKTIGRNFVHLGDEFYLMAGVDLPTYDSYEDFPQIENGVGLCSSLIYEFNLAISDTVVKIPKRKKAIATGKLAFPIIKELIEKLNGDMIRVYEIENDYFGHDITVAGLITGKDLVSQLKNCDLGEELLISSSMLRHDEDVFLDNLTLDEARRELGVKITAVQNDGYELLDAVIG
ncbi:MAG: DUF512 domain-containing protein, partial [Oscillospiraceae bacterium]